jgi:cyclic-di-GMP phosphodiesterase TipF (flagellum assembly factor)
MLDAIVLIAMAVTAAAFAVGLIVQSGIAQIPALIAAAALYLVMAASYLMVARSSRPTGGGGDRLSEFEEAFEIIDKDLQRIDRIEDEVSRLDMLAERVERVDQALSEYAATAPIGGLSRSEHFNQEFEDIHAKIEAVRSDLESDTRDQREKMTRDLRMLESLIKQLSRELIGTARAEPEPEPEPAPLRPRARFTPPPAPDYLAEAKMIEPEPEPELAEVPELEPLPQEEEEEETLTVLEIVEEVMVEAEEPLRGVGDEAPLRGGVAEEEAFKEALPAEERAEEISTPKEQAPIASPPPPVTEPAPEIVVPKVETAPIDEPEMLEIMSQAIESGRVDLYLQPAVTLPERKPRYFEALTRIRTKTDKLILPGTYLKIAESSGMIPLIDNVELVKSVQTLRRLGSASCIKGVFCNVSFKTLLDPEFFPEMVEFMEENAGLSESLIFEVNQPDLLSLNEAELGALDTLAALGYGFSLDHVSDFDFDLIGMRDRSFRFVKIEAKSFLNGMKDAPYSASDIKRALDEFDMQLIVEKVEAEDEVAKLLDYGVELAQGHLFGKPKPMSPALFREIENADAA